ncbi:MAG: hypothetical protein KJ630_11710 [Proteobacteria bacterium]|nr:hypothetical protein [Pseudomonadota bacterium]
MGQMQSFRSGKAVLIVLEEEGPDLGELVDYRRDGGCLVISSLHSVSFLFKFFKLLLALYHTHPARACQLKK